MSDLEVDLSNIQQALANLTDNPLAIQVQILKDIQQQLAEALTTVGN
ncbi:MAG: hypothetical protein E6700_04390 [Winkia neuii]|nr:hypothetical protein HMPREF3198_01742 [Winkia neuii]MDU3134798.1 hypothetical protein [Winkia neuii]